MKYDFDLFRQIKFFAGSVSVFVGHVIEIRLGLTVIDNTP